MSEVIDYILYFIVAGVVFLPLLRGRTKQPKQHNWFEVGSSDIANAERKKRKGK